MATLSAPPAVPVPRARRLGFLALAALLAALTGLAMGGLPALVQAFVVTGEDVVHQVHILHWGVFMGILTAVPLAALARRPSIAPAQQATVVVLAFVVAATVARMVDPAVVVFPVLIGGLLLLHPARNRLLAAGEGLHPGLAVLAAAVTVPGLWYAVAEVRTHLAAPLSDIHRGPPEAHYVTGAALALAIVGLAWLASLRTEGWRLPAWCCGIAMALNGVVSIWLPDWVGSFGRAWGIAAVAWGVAVVIVAERAARDTRG